MSESGGIETAGVYGNTVGHDERDSLYRKLLRGKLIGLTPVGVAYSQSHGVRKGDRPVIGPIRPIGPIGPVFYKSDKSPTKAFANAA
ncbi:MAG: hypothetical protein AMXMBFR82_10740 [Candidatus Hydrogenedentota bacterium]